MQPCKNYCKGQTNWRGVLKMRLLTIMLLIESHLKIWVKWNQLYELLYFTKLERKKDSILKDLGKHKITHWKMAICERGAKDNALPTLSSMLSVLDFILPAVTKRQSPLDRWVMPAVLSAVVFSEPSTGTCALMRTCGCAERRGRGYLNWSFSHKIWNV